MGGVLGTFRDKGSQHTSQLCVHDLPVLQTGIQIEKGATNVFELCPHALCLQLLVPHSAAYFLRELDLLHGGVGTYMHSIACETTFC